jgi:uncharacterized protein YndB with AHSA1/START domain
MTDQTPPDPAPLRLKRTFSAPTEAAPPERLVFTRTWDGYEGHEGTQLVEVEVEFWKEEDGATTVVPTNRGLTDEESKRTHRQGWEASFANLDHVLAE